MIFISACWWQDYSFVSLFTWSNITWKSACIKTIKMKFDTSSPNTTADWSEEMIGTTSHALRAPKNHWIPHEGNSIRGVPIFRVRHDKSREELIAVWSCPVWVQSRVPCTSPRCLSLLLPFLSPPSLSLSLYIYIYISLSLSHLPGPSLTFCVPLPRFASAATGWHPTNKISSRNARDDTGSVGPLSESFLSSVTLTVYLKKEREGPIWTDASGTRTVRGPHGMRRNIW